MKLFEKPSPPTPQDVLIGTLRGNARTFLAAAQTAQNAGIPVVWNNPKITPQQACDALGTDAAKTFELHGKLTELLIAIAQEGGVQATVKLPTNAFTVNADGTVTVSDKPYGQTP